MNVEEIMISPVYTCSEHEPLSRAAQLMWDHDVGVVPVVDRAGRAIAMITDRDICMAALTQGRPVTELLVEQAMSKLLYSCHPDDRLSAAERTMRVHQVRRLPVVDDAGRLLGILSMNDVCRARASAPGLGAEMLTTMAAIGKRRAVSVKEALHRSDDTTTYRASDVFAASPRMPPTPIRDPVALFRF